VQPLFYAGISWPLQQAQAELRGKNQGNKTIFPGDFLAVPFKGLSF